MVRFLCSSKKEKEMKLAMKLLVAVALIVCASAEARAQAGTLPLDHFMCYKAKPPKGTPKFVPISEVMLWDQFERVTFEVKKPLGICNPAQKFEEPVYDAKTHLKAYAIKAMRDSAKPTERESLVKDQFHRNGLRMLTKRAQILLVPTSKDLGNVVPPPPDPATHVVDHFMCYKAKPPKGMKWDKVTGVKVEDQFLQPKLYNLLPRWLCNPADKYWQGKVEPRHIPQRHLLCYIARPAKGQPKHEPRRVSVNNQFGSEVLDTVKEDIFCIPAEKEIIVPQPTCGDNAVNQASEQCDGADDNACPGQCKPDCTCPTTEPFCGDGTVNQPSEECDPPGSVCAGGFGICSTDCKCNETDIFSATTAQVEVRFPNGASEIINMSGPTTVEVRLGGISDMDGDGREEVETEMLQLELTGTSPMLGPVNVRLNPTMPSRGMIKEQTNNTPGVLDLPPLAPSGLADSFFDVFFDIEVAGQTLHNQQPKHMRTVITHKPPAEGETYEDPTPIELYDENGRPTGITLVGAHHTPNPPHDLCGNGRVDPGELCDWSANPPTCACSTLVVVGSCGNDCRTCYGCP
ncbi:MAG: hypothetical protein A3C80_00100 [Candidatus Ryanbacteria bacterium RIFCSPHIGHO2_02_FULL_45_43]|uniref:Uncharacterized protein n=1 Tax=Candidatus Ryanbacteria bacterium RIFCSPHIGHO2_01_45_13 TaxID=1802112 RepID=A0A1G2G083_9BACT|nr:MAG: hypothetical protein A2718_01485 [Candidatus Ryanbacteria bacterium RIFCSPHIGHO2_01_FULL_44_130]OGZ43743.1 MAG: hypothetical protein A2W41_04605 [Candidatus Ryanbacteria bacterium RIFCSPHIGHO2_01_45_13]OGZ47685.1 MAG: hypothetical protein A3C80_00100 [Candidatus Ryanbacteria bacterium RIFCSPHIGHO2_02_FULL_45_43]OGZ49582.1 MAG: hypothetical protein A3E55_04105 [Candidatus Ryanbacteria bacterium RIFCSPHIGHO2_12_FULL_44_20]OGZ51264.1 MAG: hypothetical protein A3A17_04430 [Candidatus Ryanba